MGKGIRLIPKRKLVDMGGRREQFLVTGSSGMPPSPPPSPAPSPNYLVEATGGEPVKSIAAIAKKLALKWAILFAR